jgi:PAS domain S-box-containing protein
LPTPHQPDQASAIARCLGQLKHTCQCEPSRPDFGEGCPRLSECLQTLVLFPSTLLRFSVAPDGRSQLLFASDNFADIHFMHPAAAQQNVEPLFAMVHQQDFDRVLVSMIQAARSKTPWLCQYRIIWPTGQERLLRTCVVSIPGEDSGLTGYGVIKDMTTLPALQRSLAEFCENAAIGVFRVGANDQYLNVNEHYAKLCGYDSPEELVLQGGLFSRQFAICREEREALARLTAERGALERYPVELRTRDGDTRWISLNARPVRTSQGEEDGFEFFCADITEKVRRELLAGRMTSLSAARFGGESEKPGDTTSAGLCPLLTYVRDAILWRLRLPAPR